MRNLFGRPGGSRAPDVSGVLTGVGRRVVGVYLAPDHSTDEAGGVSDEDSPHPGSTRTAEVNLVVRPTQLVNVPQGSSLEEYWFPASVALVRVGVVVSVP